MAVQVNAVQIENSSEKNAALGATGSKNANNGLIHREKAAPTIRQISVLENSTSNNA